MALTAGEVFQLRAAAERYGLPAEFVLGVIDKESAGNALWTVGKKKLPAIRIEGHYFYRLLGSVDTKKRDEAVKLGLAAKKAGAVKNPTNYEARYALLERMKDVHLEMAYRSISMGIGQIMGEHYKRLGYPSAFDMFAEATKGLMAQAEQMLKFINTDAGLLAAARAKNYAKFARIYNGPAYGDYDKSLKKFVEKWAGNTVTPLFDAGLADPATEDEQRILLLGYSNVKEFQKIAGLKADGIVGPLTRNAITAAENRIRAEKTGLRDSATKVAVTAATSGGAVAIPVLSGLDFDTISKYTDYAKGLVDVPGQFLLYGIGGVALIAGGVAIYEWIKNRKPADVV